MRILMTSDTVGGVWNYCVELMRAMRPHGAQFALATMGAPISEDQWRQLAALDHVTVHESTYKLEWMDDPWDDLLRAEQWLLDLEQQYQPDLIHLNGYAHGVLPWSCPSLIVAHSCCLSWWEAVKKEPAPPQWDRYRSAVMHGLHSVDRIIAPTEAMMREVQRLYGPVSSTAVMPNARDPDLFVPGPKDRVVLTAGRVWDEAKNVAALCRAAPALRWPVQVAGDARDPNGRTAPFAGVQVLGRLSQEQLAPHYMRAGIFALPARYEPFGLCALEAGLSGCALVLGDIPSLREVWGEAALFVPPDDVDALIEAINRIADSTALRVDLAASAQARAFHYQPQRLAGQYLEAYRQLMEKPAAASMSSGAVDPMPALLEDHERGQDAGVPA